MQTSSNKRIIKNTGFLYIRMIFTMTVTLYTSRVVLSALGVIDYGLYNVVGGLVVVLSFLNAALSSSTSRFLTYEIGKKDCIKLQRVFSSALTIHLMLGLIILVLAETVGLWFLLNKMTIPEERVAAAIWAYQFSILTFLISVAQVPYDALIVAHEKMRVYTFVAIVEVTLKLLVAYLLVLMSYDKLITYSVLMFFSSVSIAMVYFIYCFRNYRESHFKFEWDKSLYISLTSFSGWSMTGSLSYALLIQGSNILLNIFFGPAVNASRAIAVQVNGAISSFVQSFRIAVNPQIIKLYAAGDVQEMKNLVVNSTKFSYFLLLFLILPVLVETKLILNLWLGVVPEYAVTFVRLTLIYTLLTIFDSSFFTVFNAIGRLKENAIISPLIGIWLIPISYLLFKFGYSPLALFYVQIINAIILSFLIKPILLCRYAGYRPKEFVEIFSPCFIVTLVSLILPMLAYHYFEDGWQRFLLVGLISAFSVSTAVLYIGINKDIRVKVFCFALSKIRLY